MPALAGVVALLTVLVSITAAHAPATAAAIADEPGARFLVDGPVIHAVAADLDGDGAREIVALTGAPDGEVRLEAWGWDGGWEPIGEPVPVPRPGDAAAGDDVERGPIRLHVRDVPDGERVTLARQPVGAEPDFVDPCCLQLDDVVLRAGRIEVVAVTEPVDAVGALRVIDLDGDGTDELVGTRSLPPLGDIGYPIETLVFSWDGVAFGAPRVGELPVGSGDTPFLLGDSDGRPGEELGLIATIGRPAFYRVGLGPDGALRAEDAGLVPLPAVAVAVPIEDGRGVAVVDGDGVIQVRSWPAGETIGEPIGPRRRMIGISPIGPVDTADGPMLVARQALDAELLRVLRLPTLRPGPGDGFQGGLAVRPTVVTPYVGPLPGAGVTGGDAVLVGGRLVGPTIGDGREPVSAFASLPGAAPVGVAGIDGSWLVVHHGATAVDPSGGRLDPPAVAPGSGLSVAPIASAAVPTSDGGDLEPPTSGLVPDGRRLLVGREGFLATIEAPPGSRVYAAGTDPSVVASVAVVGERGSLRIPLRPTSTTLPDPRLRLSLTVVTPAGHGHVAAWDVTVVTEAPELRVEAAGSLGTPAIAVAGTAGRATEVTVDGRAATLRPDGTFSATVAAPPWPTDVAVVARDVFGNETRRVISVVGFLDYRGLPWLAIVGVGVAGVAGVLALRVPRAAPTTDRRADDDAGLEELDPDDES